MSNANNTINSNDSAQDSHPFVDTQQQQQEHHIEEEQDVSHEDASASKKPCLVKPTSKTSIYWAHFMLHSGLSDPGKKGYAKCIICQADVSVKNGTDEYEKLQINTTNATSSGSNGTLRQFFQPAPKGQSDDERKKRFEEACIAWVIEESQPLSVVSKPSFRRMINQTDKKANKLFLVTAEKVRDGILKLGKIAKEATKQELKLHKFAITTDHWTGPNDETYTVLTGHYITRDWMYTSCIMDFKVWEGRTTGERMAADVREVFDSFHATNNVIMATTDTTGNMITFGSYLETIGIQHAFCVDHNLHRNALIAFEGTSLSPFDQIFPCCFFMSIAILTRALSSDKNIPGANNAMKMAREVVEYFTKSTQAMNKLLNAQKNSQHEKYVGRNPLKPLQDVRTRWWSTWRML
jgi:hypothetical protein